MIVIVQFHCQSCHQPRASAARRAARPRPAVTVQSPARVGVVTRSVWPRSSIEDSFSVTCGPIYIAHDPLCNEYDVSLSVRLSVTLVDYDHILVCYNKKWKWAHNRIGPCIV